MDAQKSIPEDSTETADMHKILITKDNYILICMSIITLQCNRDLDGQGRSVWIPKTWVATVKEERTDFGGEHWELTTLIPIPSA